MGVVQCSYNHFSFSFDVICKLGSLGWFLDYSHLRKDAFLFQQWVGLKNLYSIMKWFWQDLVLFVQSINSPQLPSLFLNQGNTVPFWSQPLCAWVPHSEKSSTCSDKEIKATEHVLRTIVIWDTTDHLKILALDLYTMILEISTKWYTCS